LEARATPPEDVTPVVIVAVYVVLLMSCAVGVRVATFAA
jgi:hypothetical protein